MVNPIDAYTLSSSNKYKAVGPTNEVIKVVNGMKRQRLGGSDIIVSELGLGTQRCKKITKKCEIREESIKQFLFLSAKKTS